jgi:transcription elongation factor Elf1
MAGRTIPFGCPICGRKKEYPVEEMVEGAVLECPFCKLKLTLHGHMLQEVREQIGKLKAAKG